MRSQQHLHERPNVRAPHTVQSGNVSFCFLALFSWIDSLIAPVNSTEHVPAII